MHYSTFSLSLSNTHKHHIHLPHYWRHHHPLCPHHTVKIVSVVPFASHLIEKEELEVAHDGDEVPVHIVVNGEHTKHFESFQGHIGEKDRVAT